MPSAKQAILLLDVNDFHEQIQIERNMMDSTFLKIKKKINKADHSIVCQAKPIQEDPSFH